MSENRFRIGKTWFEEGFEEGLKRAEQEMAAPALRRVLQRHLERHFGAPLSPEARARLESWSGDRLEEFYTQLLTGRSPDELGLGPDRPA
jgi:hypothetical protein